MAMDNIQKSIIAVLGLSAVIALMTPTTGFDNANTAPAPVTGQDLVQVPSPPDKGQDAPPAEDELSADEAASEGPTEEQAIAFGEPTNSGLPFGQKPEAKNTAEEASESNNLYAGAPQNTFTPEATPVQVANTNQAAPLQENYPFPRP
jgi:hypothetical protein